MLFVSPHYVINIAEYHFLVYTKLLLLSLTCVYPLSVAVEVHWCI